MTTRWRGQSQASAAACAPDHAWYCARQSVRCQRAMRRIEPETQDFEHALGVADDFEPRLTRIQLNPGDLVLGDDNGLIVLAPDAARDVLGKALASDAAEPDILARIASGEPLESILAL